MAACRCTVKVDRSFWKSNINRKVGFHSGWLPCLMQLGVIQRVRARTARTMTMDDVHYAVQPFTAKHTLRFIAATRLQHFLAGLVLPRVLYLFVLLCNH